MRSQAEQLTAYLQQEEKIPKIAIGVEIALARANLLRPLEKVGIVPIVTNPNPFHPIARTADHESWWQEHREARVAFYKALEERQLALRRLYVGSQLASIFSSINE